MSLTPLPEGATPWANSPAPILLDFWAPWCASCKNMEPVLADLAKSFPDVQCFKVNTDDGAHGSAISQSFGVSSLPTLVLIQGGKIVNRASGSMGRTKLMEFLSTAS
jgi:thioredoxin